MKRKIFFTTFCSLFLAAFLLAQDINIIPEPVNAEKKEGIAVISPSSIIVYSNADGVKAASFLNNYLQSFYGFKLKAVKTALPNPKPSQIVFKINTETKNPEGAYTLRVNSKQIDIEGHGDGFIHGVASFIQLLPVDAKTKSLTIPNCFIYDYPRFAYRGLHLDVGRHFLPVSFIKKYIDYIAMNKMNYFHWHLTEDQGWRIEIKKYPNLTKTGAWRNGTIIGRYPGEGNDETPSGGFYTQAQIKDIVKYASDRFITIIPEIELPGHGSAAIAAYPWLSCFPEEPTVIPLEMKSAKSTEQQEKGRIKLVQETWGVFDDVFCAGKDSTFTFLQNVMDEVIQLFPSKLIHIGGDECPKANWKRCPNCQKRMKDEGLKDEHELQSYFVSRIEKYLNAKGRKIIGWDEILEGGLAPNAAVMSWRGEAGGIEAAKQGHDVVMTPTTYVYFDYTQSENEDSVTIGGYIPLDKVYNYEPEPKELNETDAKFILGAQANLWTEYVSNAAKVEYMMFPRVAALSEVLWSPKSKRNWDDFEKRMRQQFKRYDFTKTTYSKAYFNLKATVIPAAGANGVLMQLESKIDDGYIGYPSEAGSSLMIKYREPVKIDKSGLFTASYFSNANIPVSEISQQLYFNKATGKNIELTNAPSKNYPGDGAFTLVNGIQNIKGLAKGKEFLGFMGTDCEAIIDFGSETEFQEIIGHVLEQKGSWIYNPSQMDIAISNDGKNFNYAGTSKKLLVEGKNSKIAVRFESPLKTRYLKVTIKNIGTIPEGMPGAGSPAWLFVDEIEVN